ncbi:MAG: hypothetical protein VKK42_16295 [Lyngbya sp.]|nr:hypothetical protein [Lyngbya sp.]
MTPATRANAIPPRVNGGFTQVVSQAPAQEIDFYTDHFFYQANPELQGRKLTSRDRDYLREWDNLRAAIAPLIKPTEEACPFEKPDGRWEFDIDGKPESYSSAYDYLADVIFYSRYPQMLGQKLSPGTVFAREWSTIRKRLYVSTCGL